MSVATEFCLRVTLNRCAGVTQTFFNATIRVVLRTTTGCILEMVAPGCCAAIRGAGAHPATQTVAAVGTVGAGVYTDPSGIVTVLPEFTFDAETTGQAEPTGFIASGIRGDTFV